MRRLIAALLIITVLSGCATVGTKEGFAVCKAADVATTIIVLGKGGVEKNPLMAWVVTHWGYLGLIGVSALMVAAVYYFVDGHEDTPEAQAGLTAMNVITCGVAARNATFIK